MAFAEGRPDETAQNYGKSTNTQSHDFIGLVLGYNDEEKYVDLEQRNNFKVGDKVEFCQPKGELVEAVIEKNDRRRWQSYRRSTSCANEGSFVYGYKIGTIFHDAPRV